MIRKLMVLGLVTGLFFTGFSVCHVEPAFAAEEVAKKDRKYAANEIDSKVKERANQLIETFDGKFFTYDGTRAGYSGSGDDNVLRILNKSKRVRNLNKKNKGGARPPDKSCLPYIYTEYGQMMPPSYSCVSFAMYAQWYLFANWYNDDVEVYKVIDDYKFNYKNMKKYGRVGDVIWTYGGFSSGHASVVLDITKEGVKVLDSNTAMYSNADYGDNRVCVYILEYDDQYGVTISRPKNYYIHYSDGLKKTSYKKEARTIHEQVVAKGDTAKIQSKKFKREGYTYSHYYVTKVKNGKTYYFCKNTKSNKNSWRTAKNITKSYKKVKVKVGGKFTLGSDRVKNGKEITLVPVWKKTS